VESAAFVQCKNGDCVLVKWLYVGCNNEVQHPGTASPMTPLQGRLLIANPVQESRS
jgi:hypothetical protein